MQKWERKMNPRINKIFLLLLILATYIRCSDEGSDINLNRTYESTRIEFSQVRIFVKNGEITDKNVVNQVMQRYNKLNTFDFEFLEKDKQMEADDITVISFNNGIGMSQINSPSESNEYSFLKSSDFIRFIGVDTLSYIESFETASSKFITEHLISHQPLYKKIELIPGSTSFSTLITTLPEMYAKIQPGRLKFPVIGYFLFNTSEDYGNLNRNTNVTSATSINNELSETVYNGLSQQDTLLVQQNWVIFE